MVEVLIRNGHHADLETIAEFNCRLAWETERLRLDPDQIRAGVAAVLQERAEAHYFVAIVDSEIAGQLMLTREWSDWRNGWFYWIQSVYVSEPFRRRGVFRRLLEHAKDVVTADPRGVGLRLYVEETNAAAQVTYGRLGLQPAGYRVLEMGIRQQLQRDEVVPRLEPSLNAGLPRLGET